MFGRGGGGGGHHSGGGGGHHSHGGHRGGGRRGGGWTANYTYPVYVEDCDTFYNPNTGQLECVPPILPTMSGLSGLFDIFSSGPSDADVGNQVLSAYYNEAANFPEFSGYPTYEAWTTWLDSQVPDFVTFIGNLVNMNVASTTPGDAATRLAQLANSSGGQANISAITSTAGGSGNTVNYMAAIPEVAEQTAVGVVTTAANVAANVGGGVLDTLNLAKYLPWILGAAAGLYIYTMAKSSGKGVGEGARALGTSAGESLKRLSEAARARISKKNPRRKRRR